MEDYGQVVMRNRGGKGTRLFLMLLVLTYPVWPWLSLVVFKSYPSLVAVSIICASTGLTLILLPHKPKMVKLGGTNMTLVFRKGEKDVDLRSILRVEWRISTFGCMINIKSDNGDLIQAISLDATILNEMLQRARRARPELDWRQFTDKDTSRKRSAIRQVMMTRNEMEEYQLSFWRIAARKGIEEERISGITIDRTRYDSVYWGHELKPARRAGQTIQTRH